MIGGPKKRLENAGFNEGRDSVRYKEIVMSKGLGKDQEKLIQGVTCDTCRGIKMGPWLSCNCGDSHA